MPIEATGAHELIKNELGVKAIFSNQEPGKLIIYQCPAGVGSSSTDEAIANTPVLGFHLHYPSRELAVP